MSIEIIPGTIDDAATLSRLGAQTFTETFGHMYAREDLAMFLEKSHSQEFYARLLADPDCEVWIAQTRDGEAVGYATATPCSLPVPNKPKNSGELQRFYILPDHQGGGLGSQLLIIALDWLEENFHHIYLSVYAENFGAQRLYERFGFEKIHAYHYMVGNQADPEYIMQRRENQGD